VGSDQAEVTVGDALAEAVQCPEGVHAAELADDAVIGSVDKQVTHAFWSPGRPTGNRLRQIDRKLARPHLPSCTRLGERTMTALFSLRSRGDHRAPPCARTVREFGSTKPTTAELRPFHDDLSGSPPGGWGTGSPARAHALLRRQPYIEIA
jgi:hypothetical protein